MVKEKYLQSAKQYSSYLMMVWILFFTHLMMVLILFFTHLMVMRILSFFWKSCMKLESTWHHWLQFHQPTYILPLLKYLLRFPIVSYCCNQTARSSKIELLLYQRNAYIEIRYTCSYGIYQTKARQCLVLPRRPGPRWRTKALCTQLHFQRTWPWRTLKENNKKKCLKKNLYWLLSFLVFVLVIQKYWLLYWILHT